MMASHFLALRNLDRYWYSLVGYIQRRRDGVIEILNRHMAAMTAYGMQAFIISIGSV